MSTHRVSKTDTRTWDDVVDIDFLKYLTRLIVMIDPRNDCIVVGSEKDWIGLDEAKSMLHAKEGLGLPIGNLTSQLFSNVYLNPFDQYVKRELKCKYYGRYVDDAAIVSHDKDWLLSLVPSIRNMLNSELGLELHMGKLNISEVHKGIEFLGSYIKPWRVYMSRDCINRIERKIKCFNFNKPSNVLRSVNSYLGIMQHAKTYNIRRKLFFKSEYMKIGIFDKNLSKITDKRKIYRRNKTRYCKEKNAA